jgi:hypothetical protein
MGIGQRAAQRRRRSNGQAQPNHAHRFPQAIAIAGLVRRFKGFLKPCKGGKGRIEGHL